jgi:hypothetical protein
MVRGATEPGLQRQPMRLEGARDLQARSEEAGKAVPSARSKAPLPKRPASEGKE